MVAAIRRAINERLILVAVFVFFSSACQANELNYQVDFHAQVEPSMLVATIEIKQARDVVRLVDFAAPENLYSVLEFSGELSQSDGRIRWQPPATGGSIRYTYKVDRLRDSGYAARLSERGIIARLDHIFPRATVRTIKGAQSISSLTIGSPESWSFESRYGSIKPTVALPDEGRNYTRPTGWLIGGELATRRETIVNRKIATSALRGDGSRQMEMLTFMQWTFPYVVEVLPNFPERQLIVVGGEGMWRGALSAPSSLYMQVDRPLVSGNGTSTLLHELFHVGGLHSAADGDDWIVEGLAEYYSLVILRRAGGIDDERFNSALAKLETWADMESGELASPSKGADTAHAVLIFHQLAQELMAAGQSLDAVVQALVESEEPISSARLTQICDSLLGERSRILQKLVDSR